MIKNGYLIIDNYDSFVYNLAAYIGELGRYVKVIRNDDINLEQMDTMLKEDNIKGIILSPGPKSPKDSGISGEIVMEYFDKIPMLGVCLGHQIIAYEFGANIIKGAYPMHGKVTGIHHNGEGVFKNLPSHYEVTRYHSLVVQEDSLPDCFQIDAKSEDGCIMAIHHKEFPLYGVQFHPEAVLTQYGHDLLENFLIQCEEKPNEDNHETIRELHSY